MLPIASSLRSIIRRSANLILVVGLIAGMGTNVPTSTSQPDRPARPTAPSNGLYLTDSTTNPGKVFHLETDSTLTTYYTRPVVTGLEKLTHFAFSPMDGTLFYADSNGNNIYRTGLSGEQLFYSAQLPVRDLAFDTFGDLYFSDASGSSGNGHIWEFLPAGGVVLTYTVVLTEVNNYWRGDFAFDASNNLYLSNGNVANANIYKVVSGIPNAIYPSTGEIDGFVIDGTGAFYYTDRLNAIYRFTPGNAPILAWRIPAGVIVPDINVIGAGPIPTRFTGSVDYSAGVPPATLMPLSATGQVSVPMTLLGYTAANMAMVLDSQLSLPDGSYDLGTLQSGFDHFEVVKGLLRGSVPNTVTVPPGGTILDPETVRFPGSSSSVVCCTNFIIHDPIARLPIFTRGRYLIVTTNAMLSYITDFVTFKQYQGWDVVVKTMEELGGSTTQGKRNAIRNYEKTLLAQSEGLDYVLLIGSDATVPFLKLSPFGPDPIRNPSGSRDGCGFTPTAGNQCGWPSDWYYVDLNSNWDSNGDGVVGEAFWPDPMNPPAIQDNEPAFHPDIFLGRIDMDNGWSVRTALDTIMSFERDNGAWKDNALMGAAMMDYGGQYWDPADNIITGTYKPASGPTDDGKLMERTWNNILLPQGFNRVRLYEKQHPPTGFVPSTYPVDAPLTDANFTNQWHNQDFGLVKVAGHGNAAGVYRRTWVNDYDTLGVPQDPTRPVLQGGVWRSQYELDWGNLLNTWHSYAVQSPNSKPAILMAMSCSTGDASNPGNLPNTLMSNGRIAGWTGGAGVVGYRAGWTTPADGWAQTSDYDITDALFRRHLPMGNAVWTGLNDYWTALHVHDWGFIDWDYYGDPSLTYWGTGPDLRAPWPMFHYDWPGNGETALTGPYTPTLLWSASIATVPTGTLASSPVVGRDDQIVVGDANGDVRQYASNGTLQWTYHTGGAIVNAAAINTGGSVVVKSQDGKLYFINNNGTLRWSITEGSSEASPKVSGDGTIYVGGQDGSGYFVDSFQPNGVRNVRLHIDGRLTTAPSLDSDGTVYFGTANGTLYRTKFDLSSPITYPVSPGFAIGNGLALSGVNRTVIVPTTNHSVVAYTTISSSPRWTFPVSDVVQSAPAFASDGSIYFGSRDGKVYAVRFSDGTKLWEFNTGGPVDSSPAVDPTNVYVVGGMPAKLYAIKRSDGTERWSIGIGGTGGGGSSPAIGDSSIVYVVGRGGLLEAIGPYLWLRPPIIALDPRLGKIIIHINPGDPDPFSLIQIERRTIGGQWQSLGMFSPIQADVTDSNVLAGQRYNYRAITLPGVMLQHTNVISEASDYSAPIEVRARDDIPIAPSAPTVSALSSTELQISWSPAPSNTTSLLVMRKGPTDTNFITVTVAAGNVTTTVDSGLQPSTTYTYTLQAIGESGTSPQSPTGSGTTHAQTLVAPSNVIVTPLNNTQFRVCWTPSNPAYDAVIARRADGVFTPQVLGTVLAGTTCYTDTSAFADGFTYYVKHTRGTNESDWARSSRAAAPAAPTTVHYVYLPIVLKQAQ